MKLFQPLGEHNISFVFVETSSKFIITKLFIYKPGTDLLVGCGGRCTLPPSPGQVGCRGGAIFMIKQKIMRDMMKYML